MICLHVILSLVAKINCYFRSDGPFINSFTSPIRYCNNVDNWTVCVHGNVAQLMVVYHRLYLKPAPVRDSFFRFSVCSAPEKSLFLFCRGILVTSHHDSPANGQAVIFLTGLLEVLIIKLNCTFVVFWSLYFWCPLKLISAVTDQETLPQWSSFSF